MNSGVSRVFLGGFIFSMGFGGSCDDSRGEDLQQLWGSSTLQGLTFVWQIPSTTYMECFNRSLSLFYGSLLTFIEFPFSFSLIWDKKFKNVWDKDPKLLNNFKTAWIYFWWSLSLTGKLSTAMKNRCTMLYWKIKTFSFWTDHFNYRKWLLYPSYIWC